MRKLNKNYSILKPLIQRATANILIVTMLGQSLFPAYVAAHEAISDNDLHYEVNVNSQFERLFNNTVFQFEKAEFVDAEASELTYQSISDFHQALQTTSTLGKRIGDEFVQSRLIRSQIHRLLGKFNTTTHNSDEALIQHLYENAKLLAIANEFTFAQSLPESFTNNTNTDFIWPEIHTINGESVLVPIVYLSEETVNAEKVVGHVVEFSGINADFTNITVNSGNISSRRNALLSATQNFTVNEGATVTSDGDLNLQVGGTLRNNGNISAVEDINIIAGQYEQKSIVHQVKTRYGNAEFVGEISNVTAGGSLTIQTYGDIIIEGANQQALSGNITLQANGNIQIGTVTLTANEDNYFRRGERHSSSVDHIQSVLSANDSIQLMAQGAIEVSGAELIADQGTIDILAGQGVYILDETNQFQSSRNSKYRKVTEQEQQFQSIAVRSALTAGKGIVIATEFGDINLKATKLTSTNGADIRANNGAVNFLMTKEQETYFYNKVKKTFWKIKTTTIEDNVETAVYNNIIGGVKVHATHGITIELAQYDNGSTQTEGQNTVAAGIAEDIKNLKKDITNAQANGFDISNLQAQLANLSDQLLQAQFTELAQTDSLAWMQTVYNETTNGPGFQNNVKLVYQELVEIHKFEKTSSLSPAAMAIIAIAVAVAMGPAGAGLIGSSGSIGATAFASQAAMQAGALAIATQAATGLASGQGLEDTAKSLFHSDNIKATATAMVTAGAMNYLNDGGQFQLFENIPKEGLTAQQQLQSLANQSLTAVRNAAVRTGISTVINGGDLGDFEDSFKTNLLQSGIDTLGEQLASQIGAANASGNITQSIRYLSHAAVGCLTGSLTAEITDADTGLGCSSGAGGAVIGELIADSHRNFNDVEALEAGIQSTESELKSLLGIEGIEDMSNLTDIQEKILQENYEALKNVDFTKKRLLELKATGVDLAKLGAGLAAFIAGGEVNIAAAAGENAAENNAWWWLVQGAYILWKMYDTAETIEGIYDAGVELNNILSDDSLSDTEKENRRDALIKGIGYTILGDVVIGKSAGEVLGKLKDLVAGTPVGKEFTKQLNQFIDSIDNSKQFSLAGGDKIYYNSTNHSSPSGITDNKIVNKGQDTGLNKTNIPREQYTEEEWSLLKFKDGKYAPHTIERHGPHVSDEHLQLRASSGLTPDGVQQRVIPPISTKFSDATLLKEATHKVKPGSSAFDTGFASASPKQIGNGSFSTTVSMDKSVGYGFQANSSLGVGKSVSLDNNHLPKGRVTVYEPIRLDNLTHITVNYRLDTDTNTWYINTLFPSKGG